MPMQQGNLEAYLQPSIPEYAEEHVRNGNWPTEGAMEGSRNEILSLIPDGLQTNHQYLFTVVEERSHQKLDMLWVHIENERAFIYDCRIREDQRDKSYGKQALTAQEIYKKAGFKITDIHMKKILK